MQGDRSTSVCRNSARSKHVADKDSQT